MQARLENENTSVQLSTIARWITENATQGILVTNTDLRISYCNRWLERQAGKSGEEITGQTLFSIFPEIEDRGLAHYYHHALQGESRVLSQSFHQYLVELPAPTACPEVTRMLQSCRIGPLLEDDRIVGTITIVEDVTDR